jgi:Zn-finger nucleic acid-binding protein
MNCPTCTDERLVITDRQGIEVDYCPACRGIWLDRGELDKLLERADTGRSQRSGDRHRSYPPERADRREYDDDRYDRDDHFDDDRLEGRGGSRRRRRGLLSDLLDFG